MPRDHIEKIAALEHRLNELEDRNARRARTVKRAALTGGVFLTLSCVLWAGGAAAWTSVLGLFTFYPGSPAKSSEINHNFETLEGEVLQKVDQAGDTMTGDLTVNGTVTADDLAMDNLILNGVPMSFAKMRVWRGGDDTIHFTDPTGVERTYSLSLITCNGAATVDNNPPTSQAYIRQTIFPICVDIDPGIEFEWAVVETNQLQFNITGAATDDCTLLYDTGGGRFNLYVGHDSATAFGSGNTAFLMQGIGGTASSVDTTFPIGTNESFYIACL